MRTSAIVGWSLAAASIAGGCTLLWLGRDHREAPALHAVVTPRGADVGVSWSF
jgi:hypothetical protein